MERLYSKITDNSIAPQAMRLLSILVYLWFIINVIMIWNVKDMLWGVDNVFYRQGQTNTFIENFFYQLIYDATRFKLIFWTHIISAFLSLFEKKWSLIPRLITWLTAWMLFYSAIQAFNSGMMLMIMFAFYCSVVYTKATSTYRIVLTNLAYYACIIQLTLVYLVAAVYKISGDQWLQGSAIYYTLHIAHFSAPYWLDSRMIHSSLMMKTMAWFGLGYQILFPAMVWIKKGRNLFLLAGIAFHLFIGIFLHLWDFALAMIFAYAVLTDEKLAGKILSFLPSTKKASA